MVYGITSQFYFVMKFAKSIYSGFANQIVEVQTYMRGEIENTNQVCMEIFAQQRIKDQNQTHIRTRNKNQNDSNSGATTFPP